MTESFAHIQKVINDSWKQRQHPVDPVNQRKAHFCPECGKLGFRVKMDYLGNRHEQSVGCVYDVSYHWCPRCGYQGKESLRIEGKGRTGVNMGKIYGGL